MARQKRSSRTRGSRVESSLGTIFRPHFDASMAMFGVEMARSNLAAVRGIFDVGAARSAPTEVLESVTGARSEPGAVVFNAHRRNRQGALDALNSQSNFLV